MIGLMFSFERELLKTAIRYSAVKEVPGASDNRFVEISHRICKIESASGGSYTDEIPWCASGLNLWHIITVGRFDWGMVEGWLRRRALTDVIKEVKAYVDSFPNTQGQHGQTVFLEPTWSAAAISWARWGFPVPSGEEVPGNVRTNTRTGGNHVNLLVRSGMIWDTCYGANQNNMVCEMDSYMKAKRTSLRRMTR